MPLLQWTFPCPRPKHADMMKRVYDWGMRMAAHKRAPQALFCVAFVQSSFFPIPPDVMLVPMVLAQRLKAWWYATLATVGSVSGGVAAYGIGYFLLEVIGQPLLRLYGFAERFDEFAHQFNEWGVWIFIVKGMTPFPYRVLAIVAGATKMSLPAFIAGSVVARAMRFYVVAGLFYWFGAPAREFIERRLSLVMAALAALLVGGFVAIKFLV
jgi:membrane protein YqaA with SNARE-associated domain